MEYSEQLISNENAVCADFESTAQELDKCLCRRIPLTLARRFSSSLPAIRAFVPDAARYGVFAVLLTIASSLTYKTEGIVLLSEKARLNAPMPDINDLNTENCLCGLLSEDDATRFVESVLRVRAAKSDATTYGVFLAMLSWSLAFVGKPANLRWLLTQETKKLKTPKRGVRGV